MAFADKTLFVFGGENHASSEMGELRGIHTGNLTKRRKTGGAKKGEREKEKAKEKEKFVEEKKSEPAPSPSASLSSSSSSSQPQTGHRRTWSRPSAARAPPRLFADEVQEDSERETERERGSDPPAPSDPSQVGVYTAAREEEDDSGSLIDMFRRQQMQQ